MSDEKPVVNYPIRIMLIIISIVILALPLLILSDAGNMINNYKILDESSCQKIIINDTFSNVRGNYGASTYYYIVTSDNKIYELSVGRNSTKLYGWKTIVKGQEYNLKVYKEYAEFCGDKTLEIRRLEDEVV